MTKIALCLALVTGCMATYAVQSRHDQSKPPTPAWRVGVDLGAFVAGAAVAAFGPEKPHWFGLGVGLGVWAVDMTAVIATGRTN